MTVRGHRMAADGKEERKLMPVPTGAVWMGPVGLSTHTEECGRSYAGAISLVKRSIPMVRDGGLQRGVPGGLGGEDGMAGNHADSGKPALIQAIVNADARGQVERLPAHRATMGHVWALVDPLLGGVPIGERSCANADVDRWHVRIQKTGTYARFHAKGGEVARELGLFSLPCCGTQRLPDPERELMGYDVRKTVAVSHIDINGGSVRDVISGGNVGHAHGANADMRGCGVFVSVGPTRLLGEA